jgi:beta-glucosidase
MADPEHPAEKGETKYISRYIDEPNTPQFPFGYGLTYTTFSYGATQTSAKRLTLATLQNALADPARQSTVLSLNAEVTNRGARSGETLAQLYIRLEGTSVAMPVRMLKGFQKVALAPGESRKVTFEVSAGTFAFWGAENKFGVEPAHVTIWIAPDSAEGESTTLEIAETSR